MAGTRAVSAFYFFWFGGIGVFWPHYGPFLGRLGVGPGEAAAIMALNPLMGLLVPPFVGLVADARSARVWILRGMSLMAALTFATWAFEPRTRAVVYAIAILYSVSRAPIMSLADVGAFEAARRGGTSFGRLRLWGSVGFLLGAPIGGALLEHLGVRAMVLVAAAGLVAAAACAVSLPAPPIEKRVGTWPAWRAMVADPVHQRFLAAIALAHLGLGVLDAIYSIHLTRLGHGGTFVGVAWSIGVGAEVAFMWRSQAIFARIGPERVLALALAISVLRWLGTAFATHPLALLALQPLHAVAFGAVFVAGSTIARQRAPQAAPAAAQGLFIAVASAGSWAGMIAGGQLLVHVGGREAFLAAAGAAVVAAVVAWPLARTPAPRPVTRG